MSVYVAAGKLDFIIASTFPVWDLAAAGLILQESGMKVTNFSGRPWALESGEYFAANPYLHKRYLKVLKKILVK